MPFLQTLGVVATSGLALAFPPGDWSTTGDIEGQNVSVEAEVQTRGGRDYETGRPGTPTTEKYFRAAQTTCALFDGLDDPTSDLSGRCAEWERLVTEGLECDANSYYLARCTGRPVRSPPTAPLASGRQQAHPWPTSRA